MTQLTKKNYIKPEITLYEINVCSMLSSSPGNHGNHGRGPKDENGNHIGPPGQNKKNNYGGDQEDTEFGNLW